MENKNKIFITGDTHFTHDIFKLKNFKKNNKGCLTKYDFVIICGDFGFIWTQNPNNEEEKWLKWFENNPWTTLFVDGNHENHDRLATYKVEAWNGGKVHNINDSVIHLMRGQVFDLHGLTFFTMGGAPSHDIQWRTEGKSWWRNEIPSEKERKEAETNLAKHNWKVDYVITHDSPSLIADEVMCSLMFVDRDINEYNDWLQTICDKLEFNQWFFGHYHVDKELHDGKFQCMYHGIARIYR